MMNEWGDAKRRWFPDFIMSDGTYVEIKGYLSAQNSAKFSSFPEKIEVLTYKELRPVFNYVEGKYGKDFIRLYEQKIRKGA